MNQEISNFFTSLYLFSSINNMRIIPKSAIAASLLIIATGFYFPNMQTSLAGAWNAKNGSIDHVLVFQDGYFSYSIYDKANKKFIRTMGGTYSEAGGQMHANIEFDTESKDNVGGHKHFAV